MRWERTPQVLWRRTPAHVVALRPGATDPDILSGEARDLWDLLDGPRAGAELEGAIGPRWRALVEVLERPGLISSRTGPPEPAEADGRVPVGEAPVPPGAAVDPLVGAMTFWLPGGPDVVAAEPLSDAAWAALLDRARRERCLGPLGWAVGTGALAASAEQREEIERYAILGARRAVAQEADLLEVVHRLESAGIEVRVLKGSAAAHLDHVDPSFRASADHDLLVQGVDVDAAVALLVAGGYRRELPERRPGFDRSFAKDVTLQRLDGAEVDLHRLPLAGPLGLALDLEALWSQPSSFRVGGRSLLALDPTGRFCHAAWSLALTDPAPRLVPALDMAAISERHGLDPARLDALAPLGRGRAAIDLAIEVAGDLLTRPDLLPAPHGRPTPAEAGAIATYPGLGGSKARYLLAGARALPSRRDRARYLLGLLAPSREYRRARRLQHRRPEWRLAAAGARGRRRQGS